MFIRVMLILYTQFMVTQLIPVYLLFVCFFTVSLSFIFMSVQMIDTVTGPVAQPFAAQLKALIDLEGRYQPKLSGLRFIESAQDNGLRMTSRLRELEVNDLLSLTRFFGFSSESFSLAVSLLDRFLSVMKVCKCSTFCLLS